MGFSFLAVLHIPIFSLSYAKRKFYKDILVGTLYPYAKMTEPVFNDSQGGCACFVVE